VISSDAEEKGGGEKELDPSALLQTKLERLERLVALHERGALTDEDYEAERRLLLGSPDVT